MNYERIRRRGLEKVSCEIILMCLSRNIRKIFSLIGTSKIESNFWSKIDNLRKEVFPSPKQKNQKKKRAMKLFYFMTVPFNNV